MNVTQKPNLIGPVASICCLLQLLTEMGFSVNYFNVSLSFGAVCLVLLLLPNGNNLTPLNFLSNIACTSLLSLLFYNISRSDLNIGCQTLICGNWTDVFQYFGILLFTFIPIVQVNINIVLANIFYSLVVIISARIETFMNQLWVVRMMHFLEADICIVNRSKES